MWTDEMETTVVIWVDDGFQMEHEQEIGVYFYVGHVFHIRLHIEPGVRIETPS